MAKKRKPQRSAPVATTMPYKLRSGLDEANRLLKNKQQDKALQLLQELNSSYPRRPEVLVALANIHANLGETLACEGIYRQLAEIIPNEPDVFRALGSTYVQNIRPALALQTLRHYLARWPDEEGGEQVQQMVTHLEAHIPDMINEMGIDDPNALELAAQFEEVQVLISHNELHEARHVAERLVKEIPDLIPALNNLTLVHSLDGRYERAMEIAQRVLEKQPDNFHALGNMIRILVINGRIDEATPFIERLKNISAGPRDLWVKKAETFSYLGYDLAILEMAPHAEQAHASEEEPPFPGIFYHLVAVAALRQGHEEQAQQYWHKALKQDARLDLIIQNIKDMEKPVDERHAPWAFDIRTWVSPRAIQALVTQWNILREEPEGSPRMVKAMNRFLRQHPEMVTMIPLLLDRGDPPGREFALQIAKAARTPELLAALRDFALSQRGPDQMRMDAARIAAEAGLMPSGPVTMWTKGEWRELLQMSWEIYTEAEEDAQPHSPEVLRLLADGIDAIHAGQPAQGEALLKQALALEPGAPDLLNNLAAAYELQGQTEEAHALVRQIHADNPDYVMARIAVARLQVEAGEFEAAEETIKPLLSRKRIHHDEFISLARAQIELYRAQGKYEGALSWLQLWSQITGATPEIKQWQQAIAAQQKGA